ncbi:MAG: hypothetical protein UX87_C0003G0037 [Candidatus Amesbacteria bacterium GW2011_GWA1_47_16]|uniref:DUF4345 domain-containing protein n=3 Tax=Candidatus Amesiibacteriota TaxID=1752730 RepID=A0A1F4ZRL1_9BACT|nr:MAG: hypothetical protein UX87_C0003G0037 [Candidatus Amesbacteria bacterium GW2011_GWA1_47_16]OGD00085.1 MAG: hypothetical protein A2972_01050 [Candidatus Amesbacteria bacterium RIFCSPLOWO2_01_FULL_47_33]OGD00231.1 MAG: hypothetical protein A2701_01535 [Candidatus Amesbacteria bacterium RIFCSPHIGHO2_01_FULL_47_34]OGD09001.1 MAG: hypothetical protein A2395_01730 [Candidatus Amesbacteria bacterium RIFOXYB1_FULL_47_9]
MIENPPPRSKIFLSHLGCAVPAYTLLSAVPFAIFTGAGICNRGEKHLSPDNPLPFNQVEITTLFALDAIRIGLACQALTAINSPESPWTMPIIYLAIGLAETVYFFHHTSRYIPEY